MNGNRCEKHNLFYVMRVVEKRHPIRSELVRYCIECEPGKDVNANWVIDPGSDPLWRETAAT